jgi:hypothetical protein
VEWTEQVLLVGTDMLKKCLQKYVTGRDHIKNIDVGGNLILIESRICAET